MPQPPTSPYEHLIDNPFDPDSIENARRQFYHEEPGADAIDLRQREISEAEAKLEIAEAEFRTASETARLATEAAEAALTARNHIVNYLEDLRHSPIDLS